MKLSVVLATYNEEKNIKDCLQSVKNIADEIIVADGTSTDKTGQIAHLCGAKVFTVPNNPMFHRNKQLAVSKAKGEWILQLDADERVSPQLEKEIVTIINSGNQTYNGFYLPRKNWFLGKFLAKGGVYPDYVIRLFKNGRGHFPVESVHEQIEIKGDVGHLKSDLIHLADPNLEKYLMRFNRYSDLSAQDLLKEGFRPSFFGVFEYFLVKPVYWFLVRFVRHKGFIDGFQGFLFALFSSLHYPVMYSKAWEKFKNS